MFVLSVGPHPRNDALVITIGEAPKFLDPPTAGHTIFGAIVRGLGKYNVTPR